jgi:hypothetical protein
MSPDEVVAEERQRRTAKRLRLIQQMNDRLRKPTDDELRSLREHGAESWGEYITDQADNSGMRISTAFSLFTMLGEDEAFDGFVTHMEDAEGMEE